MIYIFNLEKTLCDTSHRDHLIDNDRSSNAWRDFFLAGANDGEIKEGCAKLRQLIDSDVYSSPLKGIVSKPAINKFVFWTSTPVGPNGDYEKIALEWLQVGFDLDSINWGLYMRSNDDYRGMADVKYDFLNEIQNGNPRQDILAFEHFKPVIKMLKASNITLG